MCLYMCAHTMVRDRTRARMTDAVFGNAKGTKIIGNERKGNEEG